MGMGLRLGLGLGLGRLETKRSCSLTSGADFVYYEAIRPSVRPWFVVVAFLSCQVDQHFGHLLFMVCVCLLVQRLERVRNSREGNCAGWLGCLPGGRAGGQAGRRAVWVTNSYSHSVRFTHTHVHTHQALSVYQSHLHAVGLLDICQPVCSLPRLSSPDPFHRGGNQGRGQGGGRHAQAPGRVSASLRHHAVGLWATDCSLCVLCFVFCVLRFAFCMLGLLCVLCVLCNAVPARSSSAAGKGRHASTPRFKQSQQSQHARRDTPPFPPTNPVLIDRWHPRLDCILGFPREVSWAVQPTR